MPTVDGGHWNGRRNRLPHLAGSVVGEVGGAGGFACRWKLISIAIQSRKRLCTGGGRSGSHHVGLSRVSGKRHEGKPWAYSRPIEALYGPRSAVDKRRESASRRTPSEQRLLLSPASCR